MQVDDSAIKQVIEDYVNDIVALKDALANLEKIGMTITEPLSEDIWRISEKYSALIETLIGRRSGLLEWYCWENECGKAEIEAGPPGNTRKIKNVQDLIWLAMLDIGDFYR